MRNTPALCWYTLCSNRTKSRPDEEGIETIDKAGKSPGYLGEERRADLMKKGLRHSASQEDGQRRGRERRADLMKKGLRRATNCTFWKIYMKMENEEPT